MERVLRITAASTWLVLIVLSLLPGSQRPHTGASGNVEHMLAYCGSALITGLAFADVHSRLKLLAFSGAAACFELAQVWVPGRHPGLDNWGASTVGALLGLAAAHGVAVSLRSFHAKPRP